MGRPAAKKCIVSKVVAAVLVCSGLWSATSAPAPVPYSKLLHVRAAMRDNIRLDTNVFHPAGNGRFPPFCCERPMAKEASYPPGTNPLSIMAMRW